MTEILQSNHLLLLLVTIAIGYGIGKIKFGSFKLGVAAVLFVGLFIGSLSPTLTIPEIMIFFGLAIFIYSIGLSSGPSFFENVKNNGFRDLGLVFLMLTLSAGLTLAVCHLFSLDAQVTAGLLAGATTNTPALAGLLDVIGLESFNANKIEALSQEAVAAYSFAYPMGIAGTLLALVLFGKLLKINLSEEAESLKKEYPVNQKIINKTIVIKNEAVINQSIRDLKMQHKLEVVFGRYTTSDGSTSLTNWDTKFAAGDQVVVAGEEEFVCLTARLLGEFSPEDLSVDQSEYMTKRIFVSNPKIAGERISSLNLNETYSAVITRIQRGDIDLLANPRTILELGDMVRFVARRKDIDRLRTLLGDSYEALGKVNFLTFAGGLALGLFIGMIQFNLPGNISFKLGYAGGPILIGLILGSLRKTGILVWTVSHSANQTFRQFGLAILLAGIGVNSGHTFISQIADPSSLKILFSALFISFLSAGMALIIGFKFFKIPFSILMGMMSHQPAILDFVLDRAGNKLPIIGFTLMMPLALVLKIIFVQFIYVFLS